MLDNSVGGWEEHAVVAVLPMHYVRRAALVAMDLSDLAVTVSVALMPSFDY